MKNFDFCKKSLSRKNNQSTKLFLKFAVVLHSPEMSSKACIQYEVVRSKPISKLKQNLKILDDLLSTVLVKIVLL